jgi:CNT family concentrative nucleoside transporter
MEKFQGVLGILFILGLAFAFSNNRFQINKRLVFTGLGLQIVLGILILKVPFIKMFFELIGKVVEKIDAAAFKGASFVYGGLLVNGAEGPMAYRAGENMESTMRPFIFGFNVLATIIIICILVALLYHFGIMQRIVGFLAKWMNKILRVSGVESLSNVGSAFVGQVEAQVMIQPFIKNMTRSEIMASMAGSFACISGSVMAIYASFGIEMKFLLTASLMAAPGALVIAKILYPETEKSETMGEVTISKKSQYDSAIDAITHGASDGMKISLNVFAMLIGFIALIALVDTGLSYLPFEEPIQLRTIFGWIFYPVAWLLGVPDADLQSVGQLMGTKLSINEFVAYLDMKSMMAAGVLSEKGKWIASFALCGFANFASVGIQIGGISALCPERRKDIASLGLKAMFAGTLASYMSAAIAGIILSF